MKMCLFLRLVVGLIKSSMINSQARDNRWNFQEKRETLERREEWLSTKTQSKEEVMNGGEIKSHVTKLD